MKSETLKQLEKSLEKMKDPAFEETGLSVDVKLLEEILQSVRPLNGAQLIYFRPYTDLFGTPVLDFAIQAHTRIVADAIEGLKRNVDIENLKHRNDDPRRLLLSEIQWDENRRHFAFFTSWQKTYLR